MNRIRYFLKLVGLLLASLLLLINVSCYFATFFLSEYSSGMAGVLLLFIMIITFPLMFRKLMKGTNVQTPERWLGGYWGAVMYAPNARELSKITIGLWGIFACTILIEKILPNEGRILLAGLLIPYYLNFLVALSSYYELKANNRDRLY